LSLSQALDLEILTQIQPVNKTIENFKQEHSLKSIKKKNTTLVYHNLKGGDNMSCNTSLVAIMGHLFFSNNNIAIKYYMPERKI
jgi:hypothetical protein